MTDGAKSLVAPIANSREPPEWTDQRAETSLSSCVPEIITQNRTIYTSVVAPLRMGAMWRITSIGVDGHRTEWRWQFDTRGRRGGMTHPIPRPPV